MKTSPAPRLFSQRTRSEREQHRWVWRCRHQDYRSMIDYSMSVCWVKTVLLSLSFYFTFWMNRNTKHNRNTSNLTSNCENLWLSGRLLFHFWSSSSAQLTATERFHTCPHVRKQSWDTNSKRVDFIGRTRRVGSMMSHQENKGKRSGGGRRREAIMGRRKGRGRDRASWRTTNAGAIHQGTKTESDSAPSASFTRPPSYRAENVSFVVVVLVLSSWGPPTGSFSFQHRGVACVTDRWRWHRRV